MPCGHKSGGWCMYGGSSVSFNMLVGKQNFAKTREIHNPNVVMGKPLKKRSWVTWISLVQKMTSTPLKILLKSFPNLHRDVAKVVGIHTTRSITRPLWEIVPQLRIIGRLVPAMLEFDAKKVNRLRGSFRLRFDRSLHVRFSRVEFGRKSCAMDVICKGGSVFVLPLRCLLWRNRSSCRFESLILLRSLEGSFERVGYTEIVWKMRLYELIKEQEIDLV